MNGASVGMKWRSTSRFVSSRMVPPRKGTMVPTFGPRSPTVSTPDPPAGPGNDP